MGASLLKAIPTADGLSGAVVDLALGASVGASNLAARGDHSHDWVDSGWLTPSLQNGWTIYDGTFGSAAMYRKVGPLVFIRGLLKWGLTNNVIFVLPPGYRPGIRMLFEVDTDTGHGRIDIQTNGTVTHEAGGTAYYQTSCCFVAEN